MLLDNDPAHAFVPYPAVAVPSASEGPLAGLTLAVKDLFDVAGYPTGGGSPTMLALSGVKTRTAPAVQRLLDAGARFVGKAHTDELAFSLNGKNAHFGTPRNGADPLRIPGGSSSGPASAVSNGLADIGLGSDTGGSVRGPANHCGLLGVRPTHGRVTLENCLDLAATLDTAGIFARTGEVFAAATAVLFGEDTRPLPEKPRLLMAADAFALLDEAVIEALEPALAKVEAALGSAEPVTAAPEGFEPLYWAFRYIQGREAWEADGAMIERHAPPLGPGVAERFAFSKAVTDEQVNQARETRAAFAAAFARMIGRDGVLVLPTMPDIAPLIAQPESELEVYRNKALNLLCLAGLSGLPQVSMPLASRLGAPLGLSLIGPAGSDVSLCRLAARIVG
jgi:amidase